MVSYFHSILLISEAGLTGASFSFASFTNKVWRSGGGWFALDSGNLLMVKPWVWCLGTGEYVGSEHMYRPTELVVMASRCGPPPLHLLIVNLCLHVQKSTLNLKVYQLMKPLCLTPHFHTRSFLLIVLHFFVGVVIALMPVSIQCLFLLCVFRIILFLIWFLM